jgi:hypothetical protein
MRGQFKGAKAGVRTSSSSWLRSLPAPKGCRWAWINRCLLPVKELLVALLDDGIRGVEVRFDKRESIRPNAPFDVLCAVASLTPTLTVFLCVTHLSVWIRKMPSTMAANLVGLSLSYTSTFPMGEKASAAACSRVQVIPTTFAAASRAEVSLAMKAVPLDPQ